MQKSESRDRGRQSKTPIALNAAASELLLVTLVIDVLMGCIVDHTQLAARQAARVAALPESLAQGIPSSWPATKTSGLTTLN